MNYTYADFLAFDITYNLFTTPETHNATLSGLKILIIMCSEAKPNQLF
jgi:hypothetical protein